MEEDKKTVKNKEGRGCSKIHWSKDQTMHLIRLFESHSELWDSSNKLYKSRAYKQKLFMEISKILGVDQKDIIAKMHNLRCQYNSELRKMKYKRSGSGMNEVYVPRWEYFNALNFLTNDNQSTEDQCFSSMDSYNENTITEPTDSQQNYTIDNQIPTVLQNDYYSIKRDCLQNSVQILSKPSDSHQIFADFVADQMRSMSESKCKKLRRIIQRSILDIEEEPEDTTNINTSLNDSMAQLSESSNDRCGPISNKKNRKNEKQKNFVIKLKKY